MLPAGLAGRLLCGFTDWLLTCLPGGRFRFEDMKDNAGMARVFQGTSERRPRAAMLPGCAAIFLFFFGYLALCGRMRAYSAPCAALTPAGSATVFTFGMAHRILCGVPEWLCVRLCGTWEALKVITGLFRGTAVTVFVCCAGFLLFGGALFFTAVTGLTPLPA